MAGSNPSGFKWTRSSSHYTWSTGRPRPKVGYASYQEADLVAQRRTRELGTRMCAYRCGTCPLYHVGNTTHPKPEYHEWIYLELGNRVAGHLMGENKGPAGRRRARLRSRFQAVERIRRRDGIGQKSSAA